MCCCFLAITPCQEYPYIGLRMATLGIKQLLVRWQGCKGLSYNISRNNRSEEAIRSCDGYNEEEVLGLITSMPNNYKKLFNLTFDNHFRVLPAQEQSELLLEATLP